MIINYRKIKYNQKNLKTIGSLIKKKTTDDHLNAILDDLQEFLAEDHKGLVEDIVIGKREKKKLEQVIDKWLVEKDNIQGYAQEKLTKKLIENIIGWGKLHELVEDEDVTNIFTNQKGEVIKRTSEGDVKTNIKFEPAELEIFIRSIMIRTGEKINHNVCVKDAMDTLYNVRINAAINGSPVKREVVEWPYLALRTYRVKDFKPQFFIKNGTFSQEIYDFIEKIALDTNIAIVGETDAGKSTLIELIRNIKTEKDPMRREILIQEELELTGERENSVSFFERKTDDNFEDGRKKYDMAEFAKITTRLAGKEVIIGEVRGPEAWHLARLLGIGLKGVFSIHGASAKEAVHQMVFLMSLATDASLETLTKRVCELLDFVIYISKKKIVTIAEVTGYCEETKDPVLNNIFELHIDSGNMCWEQNDLSEKMQEQMALKEALENRKV